MAEPYMDEVRAARRAMERARADLEKKEHAYLEASCASSSSQGEMPERLLFEASAAASARADANYCAALDLAKELVAKESIEICTRFKDDSETSEFAREVIRHRSFEGAASSCHMHVLRSVAGLDAETFGDLYSVFVDPNATNRVRETLKEILREREELERLTVQIMRMAQVRGK